MNTREVRECFISAKKDDAKGKKHKGLQVIKPNQRLAEEYIAKAKQNLEFCEVYKNKGVDYKLPEEWFYTLYYCALAILSKFGVESRSQRCTAAFLWYMKDKALIDYNDEFIERITVYRKKEEKSDVDRRESARYGAGIKIPEIEQDYKKMMDICRSAIAQCEEIIFSDKEFKIPKELYE